MIIKIVIVICSIVATMSVAYKYERSRIPGIIFFLIFFGPITIATNLWDFPGLSNPKKSNTATFTQDGDLEFHTWALWNPIWEDREVVEVPKWCHPMNNYAKNTSTLFKANHHVYAVHFTARTCIDNPKNFYKNKKSRKNGGYELNTFDAKVRYFLYDAHLSNEKEILWILQNTIKEDVLKAKRTKTKAKKNFSQDEAKKISSFIEGHVNNQVLQDNGLVIKITAEIVHVI